VTESQRPRTTARRIAGAFGLVLLLFALALVVMIVALRNIGAAEDEVARLDRAKQLLLEGASVTETCMELGFSSVGSFSGLFARRVGVAPSAYRRLVQVQTSFAYRGCFSLMLALPAEAFRNSREARGARARQAVPA